MANTAENSVRVDLERIGSSIRRIASVRFASTALVRLQTRNPAHLNGAVQAKRCLPDSALGILSFEAGKRRFQSAKAKDALARGAGQLDLR